MELAFQSYPYHFLRSTVREVRFQEETAEIIVPDSYPDIAVIADCCAEAILRGKDCRDGSVTVAGGVKGVILYTPEDGSYPKNLEVYIPFSVRVEHGSLTSHAEVLCSVRVRSVDARMINSRKAMLRVNLGCEITAFEQSSDVRYSLEDNVSGLQTREAVYSTSIPLETAEKSFVVSDSIEIPHGRPAISQIYRFSCRPELTDEKLVGNKAVFKGTLRCKLLYLADNEMLYLHEESLPFSQYCELNADYDEETVSTRFMITGYDLESPTVGEGQQIPLSVNILAQCVVSGPRTMALIEDAYSTKGELHPQWKEYELEGSLDQQNITQTVRQRLSGTLREVLDTNVYWEHPEIRRNGDSVEIKAPALIRVLGYDESGALQTLTGKVEAAHDMVLSDGAVCYASAFPVGEVFSSWDAGGVEVKCSVQIAVRCCSQEKLRTLCGGSIDTETQADVDRPSLIVRTVDKDTLLWDLAKTYGTTVADIMAANEMESENLAERAMLLLPMV